MAPMGEWCFCSIGKDFVVQNTNILCRTDQFFVVPSNTLQHGVVLCSMEQYFVVCSNTLYYGRLLGVFCCTLYCFVVLSKTLY